MKINNILFDFGGVFYNVDYNKSVSELAKLSSSPEIFNSMNINEFMDVPEQFECGNISPQAFRGYLRKIYNVNGTESEIDNAWNAMLIGLKPDAISFLNQVKTTYNISLFSNTNIIHYNFFMSECDLLLNIFDKYYLSFELGLRKPNINSYQAVCKNLGWELNETLFIDDSERNVYSAIEAGLQGLIFSSDMVLSDILHTI